MNDLARRAETIFHGVRALQPGEERVAFIEHACAGDERLRRLVDGLLRADEEAGSFLAPAVPDSGETVRQMSTGRAGMPERCGATIGRYKLLQEVGEGGFGTVFMAEQSEPVRRRVALKIVKAGMDTQQVVARFEQERQALAVMDHPHIARVFDAGTTDGGRPYFVMELVRGEPVTTYCDANRLGVRPRAELMLQVCQAVQHAHQKGIIHRDLKPGNVLVSTVDGRPSVKVIDFGIAKAIDHRLTDRTLFTDFHQMIGTPQYMSPEQAVGSLDIDTRSDVYALGVLLYELFSGVTPFDPHVLRTAALHELQRMIREVEALRPSTRFSGLSRRSALEPGPGRSGERNLPSGAPSSDEVAERRGTDPAGLVRTLRGDLDWIVMRCLEKDRSRRYESSADLAGDLRRYLAEEPVLAGPPGAAYRIRKLLRRRRTTVMVSAAGVLIAAVASGAAWWTRREADARRATYARLLEDEMTDTAEALGRAEAAPVGSSSEWRELEAAENRLSALLEADFAGAEQRARGDLLVARIDKAARDRNFAEVVEDVVIRAATHFDRTSWQHMEVVLRAQFAASGIDLEGLPQVEVARRIRESGATERYADALELWLGTIGTLMSFGDKRMEKPEWDAWIEVLYDADEDPIRTGIRKLLYAGRPPAVEAVDAVIAGADFGKVSPRTLSWLANVYMLAGAATRADEVFNKALLHHPGDFMLNFDYAFGLVYQSRWQEAIRYQMRCLAIRSDVAGVWRSMGNTLRETGELAGSRQALQRAVDLQPDHAATHADLAETLLRMNEPQAALESASHAISLQPDLPAAHGCAGRALMQAGRLEEALAALEKCQALGTSQGEIPPGLTDWLADCRGRLQGGKDPGLSTGMAQPTSSDNE